MDWFHFNYQDLSFNCITKIENLGKLPKLTDLSLYNNQIVTIEPEELMNNINLNVFSIGNNKIESVDTVEFQ